jgi:hypothetical protein
MPDTYMMTAEELRLRSQKRRRILVLVIVLVILSVTGYFGNRPARDAIKSWQARRHANKAFAFIEQEKWTDARDEAVAAYQLRPDQPQALRAVARFLSRTRQTEALDFWRQLDARHLLTRADRRDEVSIALAANELTTAEQAVNDLLIRKDSAPEAADWILAAQFAQQKGAGDEVRKFAQKVLDDAHADERSQFQAALLRIGTFARENADPAMAEADWARLRKLAEGKSKTALDALVILAQRELSNQRSQVTGQEAEADVASSLENHPLAAASHKLLALDLRIHADESQREKLIEEAVTRFKDADLYSLVALATWLNGKAEYQRELDVIPLEKSLQNRDLFLQHVDALGALDRWEEIERLLSSERYPLEPVIQRMYLARCNAQLGQKTAAENNWTRALEVASGDASKLITLAEYAEKNGVNDIAEKAYTAVTMQSPKVRPAWQGRLRIAQSHRDTHMLQATLGEMLKIWPNDTAVQNDEAYMRLLLLLGSNSRNNEAPRNAGEGAAGLSMSNVETDRTKTDDELPQIEHLAEELVKREPSSLPHRTLLALARLRRNRLTEALDVYSNIQVAANTLTPSALAVHAAVLFANGRVDDAKTEADQIKLDQLLSEERALVEGLTKN